MSSALNIENEQGKLLFSLTVSKSILYFF